MEELKTRSEYSKAMMPDGVAILEGTTTWCPQCKAIAPTVDKLMKKYPDARFYQVCFLRIFPPLPFQPFNQSFRSMLVRCRLRFIRKLDILCFSRRP